MNLAEDNQPELDEGQRIHQLMTAAKDAAQDLISVRKEEKKLTIDHAINVLDNTSLMFEKCLTGQHKSFQGHCSYCDGTMNGDIFVGSPTIAVYNKIRRGLSTVISGYGSTQVRGEKVTRVEAKKLKSFLATVRGGIATESQIVELEKLKAWADNANPKDAAVKAFSTETLSADRELKLANKVANAKKLIMLGRPIDENLLANPDVLAKLKAWGTKVGVTVGKDYPTK